MEKTSLIYLLYIIPKIKIASEVFGRTKLYQLNKINPFKFLCQANTIKVDDHGELYYSTV